MAEDNKEKDNSKEEKRLARVEKFTYNPESVDCICEFTVKVDHLHWKLLCKQAQDMVTTPSHLLAIIIEHYLVKTGSLDPKCPSSEGVPLAVTIQDIRDNPDVLFNFRENSLLQKKKEQSDRKTEGLSFDDDDDDLDFT